MIQRIVSREPFEPRTFPTGESNGLRKLFFATLAASLAVLPGLRADAQTVVNADVTANTTWSGVIVLARPIFVKSGATLTINPGTIIRGQPRTAAVTPGVPVGTPGALVVTQSGTIIANGTREQSDHHDDRSRGQRQRWRSRTMSTPRSDSGTRGRPAMCSSTTPR